MGKRFKAGRTVSIRVNPKDCMGVIDLADKLRYAPPGTSFSQLVSLALTSSLEALRANGIIPTRDGFEFSEMLARFPEPRDAARARALAITDTFQMAASDLKVPPAADAAQFQRGRSRFNELCVKNEADPANMSAGELEELRALALELNP